MTTSLGSNLQQIRQQLPKHVRLIAVSKQVSPQAIREAYNLGVRDFAESRIQEAIPKQEQLQDLPDICWHFIGHLQSNKAKKILEHFHWIHSCDSLKLAQRLNRLAEELSCSPSVCLQVKVWHDPQKYGWEVPQLWKDLPQLDQCTQLKIQGLMTILPLGLSDAQKSTAFAQVRDLASQIAQQDWYHIQMQELSMGMSSDYPLAVQAGATMVRLGRIIFGARKVTKS